MVKKDKPRSSEAENLTIHTTFRVPKELHDKLTAVAGRRGIGEEIRRRLEASFECEARQAEGSVEELQRAAAMVMGYFGNWRNDPFAHAVFSQAAKLILEKTRPKGEAIPKPDPNPDNLADVLFDLTEPPEKIGGTIAGFAIRDAAEKKS